MSASSEDSGNLASDIITYVGVPLAVAGVLPILWTAFMTLRAKRKIRAKLKFNKIDAEVESDGFTRVIEVRYEKHFAKPPRLVDQCDGGEKQPGRALEPENIRMICAEGHEMYIPGGTWAILQWNLLPDPQKHAQRLQHPEDLRQPQVEVIFEDLVTYLHDLGAVPDKIGWGKLRSNGIWTAPNTTLMRSPGDSPKPLLVTKMLEHSGSNLSLALTKHWGEKWTLPESSALPPYSICLPSLSVDKAETGTPDDEKNQKELICEIAYDGITIAYERSEGNASPDPYEDQIATAHLRIRNGMSSEGTWFASLATACKMADVTIGWKYAIPKDILDFARADTVPCGVLECLGVLSKQQTPSWTVEDHSERHETWQLSMKVRNELLAEDAERRMPHEIREKVSRERFEKDHLQLLDDAYSQNLREVEARERHIHDAIQSPKWNPSKVATHTLLWLQSKGLVPSSVELKDAAYILLRTMILDPKVSTSVCDVLDRWKSWVEQGGMRDYDLTALQEMPEAFGRATIVTAMIAGLKSRDSDILLDLDECVKTWEIARLG